jgi:RNA polymerase sigma factor (sigma-70 family)
LSPEDLVQEVWVRAIQYRDRFDPEKSNYRAFFFAVAKNVLLESSRKLNRRHMVGASAPNSSEPLDLGLITDGLTAVSKRLARDEGIQRIVQLCSSLKQDEKQLLVHLGLEEMSHDAVATMLGVSREAISKRWQRLKASLVSAGLPSELLVLT